MRSREADEPLGVELPKSQTKKKPHVLLGGDGDVLASELKGALRERKLKVTRERRDAVVERAAATRPDVVLLIGDAAHDGGAAIALALAAASVDTQVCALSAEGGDAAAGGDAPVLLARHSPYQIAAQVAELLERPSKRADGRVTDPVMVEKLRRRSSPANDPRRALSGAPTPAPPTAGPDPFEDDDATTGPLPSGAPADALEQDTLRPPPQAHETPRGLWSQPPGPAAQEVIPDATPTAAWGPSDRARALGKLSGESALSDDDATAAYSPGQRDAVLAALVAAGEPEGDTDPAVDTDAQRDTDATGPPAALAGLFTDDEDDMDRTAAYGLADRARALGELALSEGDEGDEEVVPAPPGTPPPEDPMTRSGEEPVVPHPDSGDFALAGETDEPPPADPLSREPASDDGLPPAVEEDGEPPQAEDPPIPELDELDRALAAGGASDPSAEDRFFKPADKPRFDLADLVAQAGAPAAGASPPVRRGGLTLRVSQLIFAGSVLVLLWVLVERVIPVLTTR